MKTEKMALFKKEFVFLGHLSTPEGLKGTERLTEAIRKMPIPDPKAEDPKKQLRSEPQGSRASVVREEVRQGHRSPQFDVSGEREAFDKTIGAMGYALE